MGRIKAQSPRRRTVLQAIAVNPLPAGCGTRCLKAYRSLCSDQDKGSIAVCQTQVHGPDLASRSGRPGGFVRMGIWLENPMVEAGFKPARRCLNPHSDSRTLMRADRNVRLPAACLRRFASRGRQAPPSQLLPQDDNVGERPACHSERSEESPVFWVVLNTATRKTHWRGDLIGIAMRSDNRMTVGIQPLVFTDHCCSLQ